jgi:hypothetical protein
MKRPFSDMKNVNKDIQRNNTAKTKISEFEFFFGE